MRGLAFAELRDIKRLAREAIRCTYDPCECYCTLFKLYMRFAMFTSFDEMAAARCLAAMCSNCLNNLGYAQYIAAACKDYVEGRIDYQTLANVLYPIILRLVILEAAKIRGIDVEALRLTRGTQSRAR